jgi:hypothetical protein
LLLRKARKRGGDTMIYLILILAYAVISAAGAVRTSLHAG